MIKTFRIVVFLLTVFYFLEQFRGLDPEFFGWQFRYLTIWTLTANMIVAGQMLRLSYGKTTQRWEAFVSFVVVMNMTVVIQYWRLYLMDPLNVSPAEGTIWWKEYYLHALGPVLMWIDAFLILGVFSRLKPVFYAAILLGIAYPAWAELVLHPLNDEPIGTVTAGLPYPFLNNMELGGRMMFYVASTLANFVFIMIAWGVSKLIRPIRV
ncbi:hypothetical protein [Amylibacter sp. IMCC11727]|uniref:hypothetical protein n=1 Tax=Amylibacter sp. IMCC11727 TaxID=3039851 RepID=UPI00244DCCCB|nr:hypothetical protein [Amylibacter sp. IMCC11727]WGI22875.1 hypothetical protein QBD29_05495 [Amylibacter sp. IMCC11727]